MTTSTFLEGTMKAGKFYFFQLWSFGCKSAFFGLIFVLRYFTYAFLVKCLQVFIACCFTVYFYSFSSFYSKLISKSTYFCYLLFLLINNKSNIENFVVLFRKWVAVIIIKTLKNFLSEQVAVFVAGAHSLFFCWMLF